MNDSIEEMLQTAETLARATGHSFGSSSKIEVHAGGAAMWGIAWFCSFCAAFMAGAMLIGGFWVSSELSRNAQERTELRRTDLDLRDYISAAYQISPEFQKRIEAEQAKAEK